QHICLSPPDGKLAAERERPRSDTRSRCRDISATCCLQPATAVSLGLDLATAVDVTLMTSRPTKIPTGTFGLIQIKRQNCGTLLLGRSSTTILGLFVLPGVIDADYTAEIQIMVHMPFPPLRIEKGQRIAQLVPLPQLTADLMPRKDQQRGTKGFGSTGIALLTMDLHDRPKKHITLCYQGSRITSTGLLDTGADTSIVDPGSWPENWPSFASADTVTGVGGFTLASRTPLVTIRIDGQSLMAVLSVVPLLPGVQCLIGRDILAQMGVVL
ncbi:POK9 protein, partial [Geococcyx californianus]|nr:POK9 protein [Geococcyx californianus]